MNEKPRIMNEKPRVMNKKAIITTILIVQLIFLAILTMSALQAEKDSFAKNTQFKKVAALRLTALHSDVTEDINYLNEISASSSAIEEYLLFVNENVPIYYNLEIFINRTRLDLCDKNLEICKEGQI